MVLALQELSIRGDISTTVDYISNLMGLPDFCDNHIDTGWLDSLIAKGGLALASPKEQGAKRDPLLNVIFGASVIAYSNCLKNEEEFIGSLEKGQIPASSLLDAIRKIELIFSGVKYRLVSVRSGNDKFAIYREAGGGEYVEVGIRGLSDGGYLLNVGGSR